MDDLISRQAAIDAILAVTGNSSVRELYEHVQEHGLSEMWSGGVNAAIDIIIAVPPVHPEPCEDTISRKAAIDALRTCYDTETITYTNGNEYIDYDQALKEIEQLPSAQPEHTNSCYTNSWCIDCKEYDTENKCCPRYNRVIKQTLDDAYMHGETDAEARFHAQQRWIPCSERLPETEEQVLIYAWNVHYVLAKYKEIRTCDGVYKMAWVTEDAYNIPQEIKHEVICWMPLPEPYAERKINE